MVNNFRQQKQRVRKSDSSIVIETGQITSDIDVDLFDSLVTIYFPESKIELSLPHTVDSESSEVTVNNGIVTIETEE